MRAAARFLFSALLLLAVFSLPASASFQQQILAQQVTDTRSLFAVDGDLTFSPVVPVAATTRVVRVSWNVPAEALRGTDGQTLILYLRARPASLPSWLSFSVDGQAGREVRFAFSCRVQNGACADGSVTARDLAVVLRPPRGATFPHEDGVVIEAAFLPFAPSAYERSAAELQSISTRLAQAASRFPFEPDFIRPRALLDEARDALEFGRDADAQLLLTRASAEVGVARAAAQARLDAAPSGTGVIVAQQTTPSPSPESQPSPLSGLFTAFPAAFPLGLTVLALLVVTFLFANAGRGRKAANLDEALADDSLAPKAVKPSDIKPKDLTSGPGDSNYFRRSNYYRERGWKP